MKRMWPWLGVPVWLVSSAIFVSGSGPPHQKPAKEDYDSGAYLYRVYCASCHGDAGRGDGPVADLEPQRPSDLTTLAQRAGGQFPRERVRTSLDGTARVPGHGKGMPNWIEVLRRTERGNERAVRERIDAIVSHVETLQR